MSNYFKLFPTIEYPGVGIAKDIVARVALDSLQTDNLTSITAPEGIRADTIAQRYYNDEHFDWIVYFANNVIDPYYDMNVSDNDLNQVIAQQYGSVEAATQYILYWRTNWRTPSANITPVQYSSLPADAKQHFNAQFDYNQRRVTSYERKKKTIKKATNILARYTMAFHLPVVAGDRVTLGAGVGIATVVSSTGLDLLLQHVIGQWDVAVVNGISSVLVQTVKSISDTEAPYYEPVTAYMEASEANQARRTLKLVDVTQSNTMKQELKRALSI